MKKNKRPEKQYFVQSTGQWKNDVFVCTGFDAKEILRAAKRINSQEYIIKWIENKSEDWNSFIESNCAFATKHPDRGTIILRLRTYEDTWDFWETLIHEISHAVDMMAEHRGFSNEGEAKAYLAEFVFHEIRRKLQGVVPKNSTGA